MFVIGRGGCPKLHSHVPIRKTRKQFLHRKLSAPPRGDYRKIYISTFTTRYFAYDDKVFRATPRAKIVMRPCPDLESSILKFTRAELGHATMCGISYNFVLRIPDRVSQEYSGLKYGIVHFATFKKCRNLTLKWG